MRSFIKGILPLCLFLLVPLATANADNYNEAVDGDLPNGFVTNITMTGGTNTVRGTLPGTPTTNQDTYNVVVPVNHTITNISFSITGGAGETRTWGFDACSSFNPNTTGTSSNTNVSVGPGTYCVQLFTNFAVNAHAWSCVFTVTAPDSDGDGLADTNEIAGKDSAGNLTGFGPTDPNDADSDNDTINDGEEVAAGADGFITNPNNADTDADNIDDDDEISGALNPFGGAQTDPTDSDSDNDTINDGEEVVAGADGFVTDPNNADTDADNIDDDDEISGVSDPFGPGDPTDPSNADSDSDTINDGAETSGSGNAFDGAPTNPNDADTDADTLRDDKESNGEDSAGASHGHGATDPNTADTDSGGVDDGPEVDVDGTNPNDGADEHVFGPLPVPPNGFLALRSVRTIGGKLRLSGCLDLGDKTVDFTQPMTVEYGTLTQSLPNGLKPNRRGTSFSVRAGNFRRTVKPPRAPSSKARVSIVVINWTDTLPPSGPGDLLHFRVVRGAFVVASDVILVGGSFRTGMQPRVDPALAIERITAKIPAGPGNDSLSLIAALPELSSITGAIHLRMGEPGNTYDVIVPKLANVTQNLPMRVRIVRPDPPGAAKPPDVWFVEFDFARGRLRVFARDIDLGTFPIGSAPFYFSVRYDGVTEHAVQVCSVNDVGTRLRYK